MRCQILFKYCLAALFAFSISACSDDSGSTDEGWHALLVPAMATDVEVANDSNVRLQVMLVSFQGENAGDGIVGKDVKWGIETGASSVNLTADKTTTGGGGLTNIDVKPTEVPGNAVIVASNDEAPKAVRFNVKVIEKPTGILSAKVDYKGAPADHVVNYSIKLYDGNAVECFNADLKYGSIIDSNTNTEAQPLLPAVDDKQARFENLSTEMRYTLIAYGYGENGAPMAAGCLDSGTKVRGNETTSVTINLDTIDLDPVSTYYVRSYFDLGDVVSSLGNVGKYINMVDDFATNLGGFLYDELFALIKSYVSSLGAQTANYVFKTFELDTKLKTYINDLVNSNQTSCKVGLFACQFRSIVRTMEFMGKVDIQRDGSVQLSGTDAYTGLAVYWRMKCSGSSDPECGRYPISTASINTGTDINLLEGSWLGSVSNGYDKLSIESYLLSLKYGKINVALLNDFLLPRVTDDKCHDMKCALGHWVSAEKIAQWLSDTLTISSIGLTVSYSKAKGWVDSAIKSIYNRLNFDSAYLEMQNAVSDIEISGTAMFKDTNADNVVDIIDGGKWAGSMTITTKTKGEYGNTTSMTTTGVKGIWSAYNAKNVEVDGKMYCTEENTSDTENRKCNYPVIDIESITPSSMCSDYAKCAN